MADLISREWLLEQMEGLENTTLLKRNFLALVNNAPSVEVVHGRWIEKTDLLGDVYYDCSVCGELFCFFDCTPEENLYRYCPNCGGKMDGERKSDYGQAENVRTHQEARQA